ncbi:DUF1211 domain-containing protein [Hymenobacter sp. UV11]|uniref:TMEM175 family protein n=1 Tax=Hymenobacter sp. UV11 TaxID=1849735 RepID=UPI00105C3FB6|nr:TMEM175 family protein [Hymenobacter sp. UV11]TDN36756.1 hypothetical protein A8B98_07130 [Hymenobacter sp. UV11]TFZ63711.1 DUF1211 domain-containing protein [Hymenobacter sp. UV11]
MSKTRLEAFSDGVLAIIITIMVLELHVPRAASFAALRGQVPVLLGYSLSYVYVGIYWTNHHHLLGSVRRIDGRVLWANLHLLFWLSLIPFTTDWVGERGLSTAPLAAYGTVLLLAAIAYLHLQNRLLVANGPQSVLAQTRDRRDWKRPLSLLLYAAGVAASFWLPALAVALYVAVAVSWLVPDRRIEHHLAQRAVEPAAPDA